MKTKLTKQKINEWQKIHDENNPTLIFQYTP